MKTMVRLVVLVGAWLPFLYVVTICLPRFAPILVKLEEKQELPSLSLWLLGFLRFNVATFGLPLIVFLAVIIILDFRIARIPPSLKRGNLANWIWFGTNILLAICAFLLTVIGSVQPVFKMSSNV
jgi:hypothetical protein